MAKVFNFQLKGCVQHEKLFTIIIYDTRVKLI